MALSKNQERVGHLRSVSKNPTAKTGREAGVVGPATGKTEHRKSTNPGGKRPGKANPEVQPKVGPRTGRGDYPVPAPDSIGDGVVR